MKYKFDTKIESPNFVDWALKVKEQNAQRAKERDAAYQNMIKQIGLGIAAGRMHGNGIDIGASDFFGNLGINNQEGAEEYMDLMGAGLDPNLLRQMNGGYQIIDDEDEFSNPWSV